MNLAAVGVVGRVVSPGSEGSPAAVGFGVAQAQGDQTAAVLSLLPDLLQARVLPDEFWVAHLAGQPSQIIGAAALIPQVIDDRKPGFRFSMRVLPGFQTQGVGRLLLKPLVEHSIQWGVDYLHSGGQLDPGGDADFLIHLGFEPSGSMHYFLGDIAKTLSLTESAVAALHQRGRIPAHFQLLALRDVPLDAVIQLQISQFPADPRAARQVIEKTLKDEASAALSFGLWNGEFLAGYMLVELNQGVPDVRYWATDPTIRQGWPAMLLLNHFLSRALSQGRVQVRYCCNGRTTATLNIARKSGAQVERLTHSYVVELAALAARLSSAAPLNPGEPA